MAKKFQTMNVANNEKGIFRLKEASRNPANRKLFNAIINGELDESVVHPSYTDVNIEFVGDELDSVCRCMTRDKIKAYQNDVNKSAQDLANQFLSALNDDNHAAKVTNSVITELSSIFNDDDDEDEIARIITMSLIRWALKGALDTRTAVKAAANESNVVELVKDSSETPCTDLVVVDGGNDTTKITDIWEAIDNDPVVSKIIGDERLSHITDNRLIKSIVQLMLYVDGENPDADEIISELNNPVLKKFFTSIAEVADEFISPDMQEKFIRKLASACIGMSDIITFMSEDDNDTAEKSASAEQESTEPEESTKESVFKFPRITKSIKVDPVETNKDTKTPNGFGKFGKYAMKKAEIIQDDVKKEDAPKTTASVFDRITDMNLAVAGLLDSPAMRKVLNEYHKVVNEKKTATAN